MIDSFGPNKDRLLWTKLAKILKKLTLDAVTPVLPTYRWNYVSRVCRGSYSKKIIRGQRWMCKDVCCRIIYKVGNWNHLLSSG